MNEKTYTDKENAHAIYNGMDDCSDEFVKDFSDIHNSKIDDAYMFSWIIRSIVDTVKINHSVLYIACGTAGYVRLFKNIKRFVGVDFSQKMINAAEQHLKKTALDFELYCTTLDQFKSSEKFDVVYLGPYGHYTPFTNEVFTISKEFLKENGLIFCTFSDPQIYGFIRNLKEMVKNFIYNRNFNYHPKKEFEKQLVRNQLNTVLQMRIQNSIGHGFLYVVEKNKDNA